MGTPSSSLSRNDAHATISPNCRDVAGTGVTQKNAGLEIQTPHQSTISSHHPAQQEMTKWGLSPFCHLRALRAALGPATIR